MIKSKEELLQQSKILWKIENREDIVPYSYFSIWADEFIKKQIAEQKLRKIK